MGRHRSQESTDDDTLRASRLAYTSWPTLPNVGRSESRLRREMSALVSEPSPKALIAGELQHQAEPFASVQVVGWHIRHGEHPSTIGTRVPSALSIHSGRRGCP